jgi:hypothetical protein
MWTFPSEKLKEIGNSDEMTFDWQAEEKLV